MKINYYKVIMLRLIVMTKIKKIIIKLKNNKNNYIIKMDYKTLIKLCQKYNIDYKNHYGKTKSYIKLKRKVDNYENVKKNRKQIII